MTKMMEKKTEPDRSMRWWEGPMLDMRRSFDDALDRFQRQFGVAPLADWGPFEVAPSVDVIEDDKKVTVTAEMPGLSLEDIDLQLTANTLYLKGEKRYEKETQDKQVHRRERRYGAFQRTITLPCEIDLETSAASFKDGVLTVALSKTAKAKEAKRKISVKRA